MHFILFIYADEFELCSTNHIMSSVANSRYIFKVNFWSEVCLTVWKLQNFSKTEIIREINLGSFISTKSAISTHLETLNFDFFKNFCTFGRLKFTKSTKSTKSRAGPLKLQKQLFLELLNSPKLISRKICVTDKFWNFHTLCFDFDYCI